MIGRPSQMFLLSLERVLLLRCQHCTACREFVGLCIAIGVQGVIPHC